MSSERERLWCPYCGLELVEVRVSGGSTLVGWTCQNCSPVYSTARVVSGIAEWMGKRSREGRRPRGPKRLPPKRRR